MTTTEIHRICPACAVGLYSECEQFEVAEVTGDGFEWIIPCALKFTGANTPVLRGGGDGPGRPVLAPDEVTDPRSTGRKRAVLLAPVLEGMMCEWSGLKFAGGGVVPIAGCNGHRLIPQKGGDDERGLYQGDLHHGPDKNTLNNAVGTNLHRICADCHHRWHAANDAFYDAAGRPGAQFPFTPVQPYFLHDAVTRATDADYELAEQWWELPKKKRGAFPFAPADELRVLPLADVSATLSQGDNPFPDSPFSEMEIS